MNKDYLWDEIEREVLRIVERVREGKINYFGFDTIMKNFLAHHKFDGYRAHYTKMARELFDEEYPINGNKKG